MFDRSSEGYRLLLSDIAAAVVGRINVAMVAPKTEDAVRRIHALALLGELTHREMQVLRGVIAGGSSKTIGRALKIRPVSVDIHRDHLMTKLGISTLAQLIAIALDAGVLPDLTAKNDNKDDSLGF